MSKLRAFTMPKWGIEMTEGVIAEWLVKENQSFEQGEVIAAIETDKITNEVEAERDGYFARLIAETGQTYPVGAILAVEAKVGETYEADEIDAFVDAFQQPGSTHTNTTQKKSSSKPAANTARDRSKAASQTKIDDSLAISPAAKAFAEENGVDVSAINGSGRNGRITYQDVSQAAKPQVAIDRKGPVSIEPIGNRFDSVYASPLAKRLAALHDIDITALEGSGPRGRVCKADVLAQMPGVGDDDLVADGPLGAVSPPPSAGGQVIAMSPMRKAIAKSLTHSKSTIPHFYLRSSVRLDAIIALRESAKLATGEAPSLNDYIVRACALSLMEHPGVNIQVHDEEIHQFASADIAVAVATDKGLLTPIVRNANEKSVAEISRNVRALAERARAGSLKLEEFRGGSFSISNLGMYGIDQFDAIINAPQGAILAVGAGSRRPIEAANSVAFATIAEISLSCDHRAIDGAVGAAFMKTLRTMIEEPQRLTG